jgi:hypothetical protein
MVNYDPELNPAWIRLLVAAIVFIAGLIFCLSPFSFFGTANSESILFGKTGFMAGVGIFLMALSVLYVMMDRNR